LNAETTASGFGWMPLVAAPAQTASENLSSTYDKPQVEA
jgi:hypothetical protein